MRYSGFLPISLLSIVLVSSAFASGSVRSGRPAPALTTPAADLTPPALRRMVARQVVNTPAVARLVPRRPVLGGRWMVGSARDIRYVAPGVVAIDYEDGHIAGRLVVRVVNPADPRTWVVLEDIPQ